MTNQGVLLSKTSTGTWRGGGSRYIEDKQQIKSQDSVSFYAVARGQADHSLPLPATGEQSSRLWTASHWLLKFNFISLNSHWEHEYRIKGFRHGGPNLTICNAGTSWSSFIQQIFTEHFCIVSETWGSKAEPGFPSWISRLWFYRHWCCYG